MATDYDHPSFPPHRTPQWFRVGVAVLILGGMIYLLAKDAKLRIEKERAEEAQAFFKMMDRMKRMD